MPAYEPSMKARRTQNGFVVTSRSTQPVQLTQKNMANSPSIHDWVEVTLEKERKGKQKSMTDEEESSVKDTDRIKLAYDAKGRRMVNQYVRVSELGRGTHGRVWLCEEIDLETGEHVAFCAMKEVYREEQQRSLKKAQRLAHGIRLNGSGNSAPSDSSLMMGLSAPVTPTEGSFAHLRPLLTDVRPVSKSDDGSMLRTGIDQALEAISPVPVDEAADSPGGSLKRFHAKIVSTDNGVFVQPTRPRRSALQMDEKVRQEIAIMKRCNHKHVVKLKEVINDPQSKKIFMILEYMAGGQIMYQDADHSGQPAMSVKQARSVFRDVLLGLEYLHYQGIIHRDIKPANLLWTDDQQTCVKISDFGVSHLSEALARHDDDEAVAAEFTEQALRKTAGSPAFFAPELCYSADYTPLQTPDEYNYHTPTLVPAVGKDIHNYFAAEVDYGEKPSLLRDRFGSSRTVAKISQATLASSGYLKDKDAPKPPIGKAIDVWALGVTLYCMLFGRTPFTAETEYALYNVIPYAEVLVPDVMGSDCIPTESSEGKEMIDLLDRLLEKDPVKRISVADIKNHPWVLRQLHDPQEWLLSTNPAHNPAVTVTTEEVIHATAPRFVLKTNVHAGLRNSVKRAIAKFGVVVGRSRRASASSNSALSSFPDGPPESPVSTSRNTSRQPSTSGTPKLRASSPTRETGLGRKWSVKNRFARSNSALPSPSPNTLDHLNQAGLTRTFSNSSAGTAASSPTFSRRPSHNTAFTTPSTLHLPSDQSEMSAPSPSESESTRSHRNNLEHKLSIKHVWNKLRSGSKTPSVHTPSRTPNPQLIDDQRSELDERMSLAETDSLSGAEALSNADAVSLAAASMDRAHFDQFGRRVVHEDEDDNPIYQQDDFSDDSLSDLDDENESLARGPEHAYNNGSGWHYHGEDLSDSNSSSPHLAHQVANPTTPRGPAQDYQERASTHRDSFEGDVDHRFEDGSAGGDSSSVDNRKQGAFLSGDDADAEADEDDRLEVNFGRSRRGTSAALSEIGSPSRSTHLPS